MFPDFQSGVLPVGRQPQSTMTNYSVIKDQPRLLLGSGGRGRTSTRRRVRACRSAIELHPINFSEPGGSRTLTDLGKNQACCQ